MQVFLVKLGGYAGSIKLPPIGVDSDTLSATERRELSSLVSGLAAEEAGVRAAAGSAPDAMTIEISVSDGTERSVYQRSDHEMTPGFSRLMEWLEQPRN